MKNGPFNHFRGVSSSYCLGVPIDVELKTLVIRAM